MVQNHVVVEIDSDSCDNDAEYIFPLFLKNYNILHYI